MSHPKRASKLPDKKCQARQFFPSPSTVPLRLPAFPRCQSLQRWSTQSPPKLISKIKVQTSVQQKSLDDDFKSMRMLRSMFAVSQSRYVSYQVRANGTIRLDTSAKSAFSLPSFPAQGGMAENSPLTILRPGVVVAAVMVRFMPTGGFRLFILPA